MSRKIDTAKPLTPDDVQYLQDRSRIRELDHLGQKGLLPEASAESLEAQHRQSETQQQPPGLALAGPPPPADDPGADFLEAWTKAQLLEELAKPKYNVTRKLDPNDKAGLKEELYAAMEDLEADAEIDADPDVEDAQASSGSTGKASSSTKEDKSAAKSSSTKK